MNYKNDKFEKELGYSANTVMLLFKQFKDNRRKYERMWRLLDAIDSGKFWDMYGKVAPEFAIEPDTNYVNYIKTAYTNSLYVGKYVPLVFPRSGDASGAAASVNEFLEYQFDKLNFSDLQKEVGESASLFNLGAIEIGWKSDIINGPEGKFIGNIEAKTIDVMSLYLDYAVKDYLKGRAIFVEETVPIVELLNEPKLRNRMNEYLKMLKEDEEPFKAPGVGDEAVFFGDKKPSSEDNTVRLLTCYYKHSTGEGYRIDKLWIIDNGFILNISKGLNPNTFPIRVLYTNTCKRDPYGIPTTRLIMYSAMTINFIDLADATIVGNSFSRPKVLSRSSGINEALFAKEGDNPRKLWVCEGNPKDIIQYIDLPNLPADRHQLRQNLEAGICLVSGVDPVYTGRDTNSVQTTGGMDILNQRLTMSDNTRMLNLQKFVISVADLIMQFFVKNGGKDVNFPRRNQYDELDEIITVDFEKMRQDQLEFDFTLNVSASTPMNIQKLAEKADILLEKQMQYNYNPPIFTQEEWIKYQDMPQKYHILRRMRDQRMQNDVVDIKSDIINYAGMVEQGMTPESAVNQLAQEKQLKRDMPGLGNTGNAGSFQNSQMG